VLVLIAIFAWSNAQNQMLVSSQFGVRAYAGGYNIWSGPLELTLAMLPILLPVAWWYLIASVISQEALPGERQFWLTRPYSRSSLAAAKILFILIFVSLPLLIAHCAILHGQGFPVLSHAAGLLLAQLMIFALWLAPSVALAVVCRTLRQFSSSALVTLVVVFISAAALHVNYEEGAGWLRWCILATLLAIVSFSILIWQYWQRKSAIGRPALVCGFLLALIIPRIPTQGAMWDWQLARSGLPQLSSAVQIAFEAKPRPQGLPYESRYGGREIDLPLRLTGLPDETELWADYVAFTIESHDGTLWTDKVQIRTVADATYWQTMWIDPTVLDRIRNEPVTLHVSAYFTLTQKLGVTRLVAQNTLQEVPGWGRCMFQTIQDRYYLGCWSAFRRPAVWTTYLALNSSQPESTSPNFAHTEHGSYLSLPEQVDLSPLTTLLRMSGGESLRPSNAMMITTKLPVARSRRDFELRDIRLGDYEAKY
jgi:hypothetical protein